MNNMKNPALNLQKLQEVTRAIEYSYLERKIITLYTFGETPHTGVIELIDQNRQALRIGPSDWIPFSKIVGAVIGSAQ